jgi:hypothetical protein
MTMHREPFDRSVKSVASTDRHLLSLTPENAGPRVSSIGRRQRCYTLSVTMTWMPWIARSPQNAAKRPNCDSVAAFFSSIGGSATSA